MGLAPQPKGQLFGLTSTLTIFVPVSAAVSVSLLPHPSNCWIDKEKSKEFQMFVSYHVSRQLLMIIRDQECIDSIRCGICTTFLS